MTEEHAPFKIGVPTVLREGRDVTIFAIGYMTTFALEAAEALKDDLSVRVVNVSTLKPVGKSALQPLQRAAEAWSPLRSTV